MDSRADTKYELQKRTDHIADVLTELEDLISQPLPDDYKAFCTAYGEIEIDINEIVILYDAQSLKEINREHEVFEYCPDILIIGGNGGGEGIAIDFKNQSPRIVLVPLIGMDREDFIEIGSSFTDMFERLENGRSWFD